MAKTQRFQDYNVDIERLATRIETYLAENHFEVAFSKDQKKPITSYFIQARKLGALRTAVGTRRSTDISIQGTSGDFEVKIGTGEWGNNLIVTAPLFVIPVIGIVATIARFYTAKKFANSLWRYIREQTTFLRDSAKPDEKGEESSDRHEFECDYIEGYPEWNSRILGGRLILERRKAGFNRLIFESPDGEQITIPASKIEKAAVISRRKGITENDLMIEITCTTKNGKVVNTVFNLADSRITAILAGINELVAEEIHLNKIQK